MDRERKDKGGPKARPGPARPEYEVAYYTKELGRPLQRKMLQAQLARLNDDSRSSRIEAAHGEDVASTPNPDRAWDDRAG